MHEGESMKLSPHFSLAEFVFSSTALAEKIDNTPPTEVIERLKLTAVGLERIRSALGDRSIKITSGYRSPELNQKIGGVKTSQHLRGEAVDFVCPSFGTPKEIVFALSEAVVELQIDQIIHEGTWVHVSFTPKPRGMVLSKIKGGFAKGVV
jgi:zinc D-Ala-D-Ala carboxypeptidase